MDWFIGKGRRKGDKDLTAPPQDDTKSYLQEEMVSEKFSVVKDADLETLVEIPLGLDSDEWIATHTVSFFEHINLMYDTLSEFCTATVCASMTGPGNTQYFWVDDKGKKCKCAGPQYVDLVMTYTQKTLHDEMVFPTKYGNTFPTTFVSVVRKIHRLLFSVLAHIYHAHYKEVVALTLHGYLNLLFEHFVTFSRRQSLLEEKDTELLDDLYEKLKKVRVKQLMEVDGQCMVMPAPPAEQTMEHEDTAKEDSLGTRTDHSEENKENVQHVTTGTPSSPVGGPPPAMVASPLAASS